MTSVIAWFDHLSRADLAVAGGKGANLGELVRAGLPVPPGFVITAPGYLQAMDGGCARRASSAGCPSTQRWASTVFRSDPTISRN